MADCKKHKDYVARNGRPKHECDECWAIWMERLTKPTKKERAYGKKK